MPRAAAPSSQSRKPAITRRTKRAPVAEKPALEYLAKLAKPDHRKSEPMTSQKDAEVFVVWHDEKAIGFASAHCRTARTHIKNTSKASTRKTSHPVTMKPKSNPPALNTRTAAQKLCIIDVLFVDPKWRRRGVATLLLEQISAYAQKSRCCEVQLKVALSNTIAKRLYAKLGFTG